MSRSRAARAASQGRDIAHDFDIVSDIVHQTTVRFDPELWGALEHEARALGVSVAQYLREAAMARLAYTAGRRGSPLFDRALTESVADGARASGGPRAMAANARDTAHEHRRESEALWAQARLARSRAKDLRVRFDPGDGEVASDRDRLPER
jgi:hypothetical protein